MPLLKMRKEWINKKVDQFSKLLFAANVSNEELYIPAYQFFERLKLFSAVYKASRVQEEREWRVVYLPDRDASHALTNMIYYWIWTTRP